LRADEFFRANEYLFTEADVMKLETLAKETAKFGASTCILLAMRAQGQSQWRKRVFAALLLGELMRRTGTVAEGLIASLAADGDWKVRDAIARAIVILGKRDPEACLALTENLRRFPNPYVVRAGLEGLRELVMVLPEVVLPIGAEFSTHPSKIVRDAAANLIKKGRQHPSREISEFARRL